MPQKWGIECQQDTKSIKIFFSLCRNGILITVPTIPGKSGYDGNTIVAQCEQPQEKCTGLITMKIQKAEHFVRLSLADYL